LKINADQFVAVPLANPAIRFELDTQNPVENSTAGKSARKK